MGKSLIQPPIKINFYYGRYLSSGCMMDGPGVYPVAGRWVMDARRPSLGGGVTPSNADTRVITALLATATEGSRKEMGAARWGEHMYLHHTGVNNKANR